MSVSRLNEVFFDTNNNTDNDFLIRIINTILDDNELNDIQKLSYFSYLTNLIHNLIEENALTRPNIKEIIYDLKDYCEIDALGELHGLHYISLIKKYVNRDKADYKTLYILCFGRLLFECYYTDYIHYILPHYAVEEADGSKTSWNIFLNAVDNNHAVML